MNGYEGFASTLRQKRKSFGLTQKQLAELIGYTEKSVSKWEAGEALPPSFLLPKLSEVLRVSIDELFNTDTEPTYFLGIDGGGTKTEFLLTDKDGHIVNRKILRESNPVDIGFDKACEILESGIREVCGDISLGKISVFAGIAGGITGDNKNKISNFLKKFRFCKYSNDSDSINAVAAALLDDDGIMVILGTGDIAFTQKNKELFRTGGFGYLFDTGGSGYSIGRDAIVEALNSEQNESNDTILIDLLKEFTGKSKLLDSISDFYEGGKKKIASAAPIVFTAYEKGDKIAKSILERNFKAVARLIIDASRHLDDTNIDVRLVGSISKNTDVISMIEKFVKQLDCHKNYNISLSTASPVIGALRLAGMKEEIKP